MDALYRFLLKPILKSNLQAIRMSTADAVISVGLVFQHPLTPAMKETAMKKNPTINIAIMARPMSERIIKLSESSKDFKYFTKM